jgi:hypothetical protein
VLSRGKPASGYFENLWIGHREHRGHGGVSFTGRGVNGLAYTNSQPYSKRACAFGLRSLSMVADVVSVGEAAEESFLFTEDSHEYLGHK